MCTPWVKDHVDCHFYQINPQRDCLVVFSFGFYSRNNHGGLNPYGLVPIPLQNLYQGPYQPDWHFAVNLRIRCRQGQNNCQQNIALAQAIHGLWQASPVWKTHPHYVNGPKDFGVDFIATPPANALYILYGDITTPEKGAIAEWMTNPPQGYGINPVIQRVQVLPPHGINLYSWILARIDDIDNLPPMIAYRQQNGLGPIPRI
ncbi:MAG: hypothetical protein WCO44_07520 [Bacteroidota bacterium]